MCRCVCLSKWDIGSWLQEMCTQLLPAWHRLLTLGAVPLYHVSPSITILHELRYTICSVCIAKVAKCRIRVTVKVKLRRK